MPGRQRGGKKAQNMVPTTASGKQSSAALTSSATSDMLPGMYPILRVFFMSLSSCSSPFSLQSPTKLERHNVVRYM